MKTQEQIRYKIDSMKDIVNTINEDNFENFMIDFSQWLALYIKVAKATREKLPKETKGKTNWEIFEGGFNWIDDGKHDIEEITLSNKKENKIHVYKIIKDNHDRQKTD